MSEASVPSKLSVGLFAPDSQVSHWDPSGVVGIALKNRFSHHQFLKRDTAVGNLFDRSAREPSFCGFYEYILISIVGSGFLVVILDEVKIDVCAYCGLNMAVPSARVFCLAGVEVRSLRRVSNDVIWYFFSESFGERDQPLLTTSTL